MNDLTIFNFKEQEVRTVLTEQGDPLFCAKDICACLGYANARDAIARHVFAEDVVKYDTPTNSTNQLMSYVNESGLYALIFGSKLEKAKSFKHWVTSVVLPSIRKTGSYSIPTLTTEQKEYVDLFMTDILLPQRLPSESGVYVPSYEEIYGFRGKAVTSSKTVALAFDKRHSSVLRSIRALSEKYEQSPHARPLEDFFIKDVYKSGATRLFPFYLLTREGLLLLAFNFTGSKAMFSRIPLMDKMEELDRILVAYNKKNKELKNEQIVPKFAALN